MDIAGRSTNSLSAQTARQHTCENHKTNSMTQTSKKTSIFVRLWPAYIVIAGFALAISQGWHTHLTPQSLAENALYLNNLVLENFAMVLSAYILIYIAATAFMVPASALTISGGFLFGLAVGVPATVVGASLGAMVLYWAAKSSLGEVLREKAGPFLGKMEAGFKENALGYMFSLRLIPAVPFAVANIAPGLLGAKFRDFAFSTVFGIIPGTIAYVWLGAAAKGTIIDAAQRGEDLDVAALFKSLAANFLPALIALGAVSLIPIIYKRFSAAKAAT